MCKKKKKITNFFRKIYINIFLDFKWKQIQTLKIMTKYFSSTCYQRNKENPKEHFTSIVLSVFIFAFLHKTFSFISNFPDFQGKFQWSLFLRIFRK